MLVNCARRYSVETTCSVTVVFPGTVTSFVVIIVEVYEPPSAKAPYAPTVAIMIIRATIAIVVFLFNSFRPSEWKTRN